MKITAWRGRVLLGVALIVALAAAYVGWFRDSSFVAVEHVTVQGVSGSDQGRIVGALTASAERMTTLHLREEQLTAAVASFPTVASVSADPDFPHGLVIEVTERQPALIAEAGGKEVLVAADGTLLPGVEAADAEQLPRLTLEELPASGLLEGEALEQALIIGAAPGPLAPLIERVERDDEYGVVIEMKGGIPIRFGTEGGAKAKWAAAAAILADPELTSVSYLDVRVPSRPAAGGAGLASSPAG